jgi:polyisoprenoid-binding protein YceI
MINFNPQNLLLSVAILCASLTSLAEVPKWQILPEKSTISFTATQNNAPVTGDFKTFSGDINFDPEQLSVSNVTIVIDIGSVKTSYAEIAKTLLTPEWFDVKSFPHATFKATSFTKLGENSYQANGTLFLRDKSSPLTLTFQLQPISKTTTIAKGEATLQRSNFGVGRGEWASTDNVKDEVKINFTLTASKK